MSNAKKDPGGKSQPAPPKNPAEWAVFRVVEHIPCYSDGKGGWSPLIEKAKRYTYDAANQQKALCRGLMVNAAKTADALANG